MRIYSCFFFFLISLALFLSLISLYVPVPGSHLFVSFVEQQIANLIILSLPLFQWKESKGVKILTDDIHFKGFFVYFFPVVHRADFNWKFQASRKRKIVEEWFGNAREDYYFWIDWASNTVYEIAL